MKWHNDLTFYDQNGRSVSVEFYHRRFFEMIQSGSIKDTGHTPLSSYLYIKTGRPRWLVSTEMARILADIPIDPDLSHVQWARDAMTLVFERGTVIDGIPLRWIRIYCPRSKLSREIIKYALNIEITDEAANALFLECDCGYGDDRQCREDRPTGEEDIIQYRLIPLGNINGDKDIGLRTEEKPLHDRIMNLATKIAASAMLLHAARPEFFVQANLPRSERYHFVGGAASREHISMVTFPLVKKVAIGQTDSANGMSKRHHYRGWVLRTLRHERFQRNPDGTCRVILVEPCEIHPELAKTAV